MGFFSPIFTGSSTVAYKHTSPPPDDGSSQALNKTAKDLGQRIEAYSVAGTATKVLTSRFNVAKAMLDGSLFKTSLKQVRNTQETVSRLHQHVETRGETRSRQEAQRVLQDNKAQVAKLAEDYAKIKRQETIVKSLTGKLVEALIRVAKHSRSNSLRVVAISADAVWRGTGYLTKCARLENAIEETRHVVDQYLQDTEKGTPES